MVFVLEPLLHVGADPGDGDVALSVVVEGAARYSGGGGGGLREGEEAKVK